MVEPKRFSFFNYLFLKPMSDDKAPTVTIYKPSYQIEPDNDETYFVI